MNVTDLGNLLSFSNGRSSPKRSDRAPYPVYGSNGIIGFTDRVNAQPRTIVIGRVGSYCGSLYYSNQSCWVTDNAIRANAIDDNDAHFLFYLLQSLHLNEWRTGSGQPLLNQSTLSSISVGVPPLPEQRAIAHILGTLDDKIELNRRMNETLEEMARALFKSWFVDFGPVRAKMEGRWRQGESPPRPPRPPLRPLPQPPGPLRAWGYPGGVGGEGAGGTLYSTCGFGVSQGKPRENDWKVPFCKGSRHESYWEFRGYTGCNQLGRR